MALVAVLSAVLAMALAASPRALAASDSDGSVPAPSHAYTLNGGYVSAGVSLRNRGSATIMVSGIPPGAEVEAAFLYWATLANVAQPNYAQGRVGGTAIVGQLLDSGAAPCWPEVETGFSYRADVSSLITGNGAQTLTGFASGATSGVDPWASDLVLPLAEGASLVVVFGHSAYPMTRIVIADGYQMVGSGAKAAATLPFGVTASDPVGAVTTTFIGADGQSSAEPSSTVNGVAITQAAWDGTDPPAARFTQGNLWDTMTASVGSLVAPGDSSATFTVSGGPDCVVWVAQVISIGVDGGLDTDSDTLKDGWEANGYDADGDGTIDVPLPAFGASPLRKDLFVEMDYMGAETTCPCHLPLAADLARITAVFASAPSARNPDGSAGIRLHLDAGSARGATYNLGGGNLVTHDSDLNPLIAQFAALKAKHFDPKRAKVFHYMIWAHGYNGGTSSGNGFAIPSDSFVVTLGKWPGHGDANAKVGTFVHEFGHGLGQRHGGDDSANYEPNYLSVMNYAFQVGGVPRTSGSPYFGFSSFAAPALTEASLDQGVGVDDDEATPYRTSWFCPDGSYVRSPGTANGPLDWNCNGGASGRVMVDVNFDGRLSTLSGWDNWDTLTFGGGSVGGGVSTVSTLASRVNPAVPDELTLTEHLSRRHP